MLFMMPWIIIAAMLDFGAFVLFVVRRDPEQGWIALCAGAALVVIGILYYLFIHIPALTVREFRPDGRHKGIKGDIEIFCRNLGRLDKFKAANSTESAFTHAMKSSNRVLSSRLFSESSPSARTSKGFLISGTRVAPSRVQVKRTISRIRRLAS